jgi:hypothetical protein
MAKDPRRFVSLTLTEDQASWIETSFKLDPSAGKADAIKAIVSGAMKTPAAAPDQATVVQPSEPAILCGAAGLDDTLKLILATAELLTQKYMADHPEKNPTRDEAAAAAARWISYRARRAEFMASNAP